MEIRKLAAQVAFGDDKMNKVNLFETPRFFCDLYCLRPGQEQKVHSHDGNDKIYYMLEGRTEVTIGDESGPLEPGEMVLAPSLVDHGIRNVSEDQAVCLVFMAPHPRLT